MTQLTNNSQVDEPKGFTIMKMLPIVAYQSKICQKIWLSDLCGYTWWEFRTSRSRENRIKEAVQDSPISSP